MKTKKHYHLFSLTECRYNHKLRLISLCLLPIFLSISFLNAGAQESGNISFLPIVIRPPLGVSVQSSSAFTPYNHPGWLYIAGEVKNQLSVNTEFIEIDAQLFDSVGNVIATNYSYSMLDILTPGMTSPFVIEFEQPPDWSMYSLTVFWNETTDRLHSLQIISETSYFDKDVVHVSGEVMNQASTPRSYIMACVTLYDANMVVIGADCDFTEPEELAHNQRATFDIGVYDWKYQPDGSKVRRYRLQVYGE